MVQIMKKLRIFCKSLSSQSLMHTTISTIFAEVKQIRIFQNMADKLILITDPFIGASLHDIYCKTIKWLYCDINLNFTHQQLEVYDVI